MVCSVLVNSNDFKIEVGVLQHLSVDDTVGEGPHARLSQISNKANRATWPWDASTMKIDSNLEDVDWMPRALNVRLETLWASYKTVLKTRNLFRGFQIDV